VCRLRRRRGMRLRRRGGVANPALARRLQHRLLRRVLGIVLGQRRRARATLSPRVGLARWRRIRRRVGDLGRGLRLRLRRCRRGRPCGRRLWSHPGCLRRGLGGRWLCRRRARHRGWWCRCRVRERLGIARVADGWTRRGLRCDIGLRRTRLTRRPRSRRRRRGPPARRRIAGRRGRGARRRCRRRA
jgi:hypothetical protein